MAQYKPRYRPKLKNHTIFVSTEEWHGDKLDYLKSQSMCLTPDEIDDFILHLQEIKAHKTQCPKALESSRESLVCNLVKTHGRNTMLSKYVRRDAFLGLWNEIEADAKAKELIINLNL